jgi:hypothetical protein
MAKSTKADSSDGVNNDLLCLPLAFDVNQKHALLILPADLDEKIPAPLWFAFGAGMLLVQVLQDLKICKLIDFRHKREEKILQQPGLKQQILDQIILGWGHKQMENFIILQQKASPCKAESRDCGLNL